MMQNWLILLKPVRQLCKLKKHLFAKIIPKYLACWMMIKVIYIWGVIP